MKRLVKITVLLLVLLVVGAVVAYFYIDSIAKAAVERGGTYALGVETTVNSATIGIFSGDFALDGLKVANPTGFKSDNFMTLDDGSVNVSLGSLTADVVEIPSLKLSEIVVNLEKSGGKANYESILKSLERFEADPEAEAKKFVIREVIIEDVTINADVAPLGGDSLTTVTVPIEKIVMTNVGESGVSKSGMTMGEIASLVVKTVLAAAVENGKGLIPGDILNGLSAGLGDLEGLKGMAVSIGGKALQDIDSIFGDFDGVGEGLKDVGDEIGDRLKGIGGGVLGGDEDDDDDE